VCVNLLVAAVGERLEDQHGRDEILLLADLHGQGAVAGVEVMQRHSRPRLVLAHAAEHAAVLGVLRAALGEGGPDDSHDVIAPLHREQPHGLFVSIRDEVATKLVRLLAHLHKLALRFPMQVAQACFHHKRQISKPPVHLDSARALDGKLDRGVQGRLVGLP
jgi:hypothetical protein